MRANVLYPKQLIYNIFSMYSYVDGKRWFIITDRI